MNYSRFTSTVSRTGALSPSRRRKMHDQTSPELAIKSNAETIIQSPNSWSSSRGTPSKYSTLVPLFLLSLAIPAFFDLGSLRLSPSRLLVLATIIPLTYAFLAGKAGKIRIADIMVIFFGIWTAVSLVVNEGLPRFPYATMLLVETIAPYLLARIIIRSAEDYLILLKYLGRIFILLAIAAIVESLTTVMPISKVLSNVASTFPKSLNYELRLGLSRAQVVFEHPILFGIFSAMLLSPMVVYARMRGQSPMHTSLFILPILVCIFLSLSSGAYVSALLQAAIAIWGILFKNYDRRWIAMVLSVVFSLVAIDLASNRSVFEVFASYTSFNSHNAFMRIHQFNFGIESVKNNFVFGLGFGEWVRPHWLPRSVDNFWLVVAMKYGAPAFILAALAFIATIATAVKSQPKSEFIRRMRTAHVSGLIATAVALSTVHIWSATYMMFFFVLGAGNWVADSEQSLN